MRLHQTQVGKSFLSRRGIGRQAALRGGDATAAALEDYRLQIEELQARNEQLEKKLADTIAANRAAMVDQRRTETALRERLEESRSAFEVAWSRFDGDPAIEDQLASLDLGSDRARRWLLEA